MSSDIPRPGAHGTPPAGPLTTGLSRRPYLDSLAAFTPDDESVITVAQLAEDPLVSLSQGGEVPDFPGSVWLNSDRGKLIYTLAFREGLERLRVHADIVSGVEKAINEAVSLGDLVEAAQLLDHLGALLENGIAGALHPVSHFRAFWDFTLCRTLCTLCAPRRSCVHGRSDHALGRPCSSSCSSARP